MPFTTAPIPSIITLNAFPPATVFFIEVPIEIKAKRRIPIPVDFIPVLIVPNSNLNIGITPRIINFNFLIETPII